jgi:hypothetical protein
MGAWSQSYANLITPPGNRVNLLDLIAALSAFGRAPGLCGGRLVLNGANLEWQRLNGLYMPLAGRLEEIPETPITLSPSGTASLQVYYIYAYLSGGTLTLEYSTTAWTLDSATGIPIKSGDASRTLVGMARAASGGGAWSDTDANRFVRSYWNRAPLRGRNVFTAQRTTTSGTPVELNSEIRVNFVCWADDLVRSVFMGTMSHDTNNGYPETWIAMDTSTDADSRQEATIPTAGNRIPICCYTAKTYSEGAHTATIHGATGSGTTAQWPANPQAAILTVTI